MKLINKKSTTCGTREWSIATVNCYKGCSHGCLYCYAMGLALRRKQVADRGEWLLEQVRTHDVFKARSFIEGDGRIMFPSTHDITPNTLFACIIVLEKLLKAGNEILIVSKPHLACIQAICKGLYKYRSQILFRFTIGGVDNRILSLWEPYAPCYEERKASLEHACQKGFLTSVSVEPMLNAERIDDLIKELSPFVSDSIWIGTMNYIGQFVNASDPAVAQDVQRIREGQNEAQLKAIYDRHKDNPQIKWKESIKKVVGIKLAQRQGMDI